MGKHRSSAAKKKKQSAFSAAAHTIKNHPVVALTALSVVLGVAWMILTRPVPFSDYFVYFKLAGGLLDEHQFGYPQSTARRLPGYPGLLTLPMLISRSYLWLGLFNIALHAAMVPLVHRFVLIMSPENRPVALVAAALIALNPTFVFFSPIIASEHYFVLLLFASILFLFTPRFGPWVSAAAAGVLLGLTLITRGEGMFQVPVILFVAWIATSGSRRQKLARSTVVLVACLAVAAPWAVRNRTVIGPGAGLSTVGGVNFYYGHNTTVYGYHSLRNAGVHIPNEGERQQYWIRRGWSNITDNPSRLFGDISAGTKALLFDSGSYAVRASMVVQSSADSGRRVHPSPWGAGFVVSVFYGFLALATVAGLFLIRTVGIIKYAILYGIILMNWLCYAVVFWGKPRFRYTTETVMCIVAAFVVCRLWQTASNLIRRRHAG